MDVEVFGPCLLMEDVPASAGFYIEHFGFQPRVELDWFTTLSHQDRPYELAFVRADHDTVPEGYRGRRTQGLIIGLLVADAVAVDARLRVPQTSRDRPGATTDRASSWALGSSAAPGSRSPSSPC